MPEGVALYGETVAPEAPAPPPVASAPPAAPASSAHSDKGQKPPPDATAPRGYTWNRDESRWVPKVKGDILYTGTSQESRQEDPAPAWQKAAGSKKKLSYAEVPKKVKDEAAGFAGLVGVPILSLLQAADPYCGTALAENFQPIVEAALPLILRSERAVRFFTSDDNDWLNWIGLAMALRPVAVAIAEHHVFRTVAVERTPTGPVVRRRERGQESHGDHLTPQPQPEYNYTA